MHGESSVVSLVPKQTFDFSDVATSSSREETIVHEHSVLGYEDGLLVVRVHSVDIGTDGSLQVLVDATAPTPDEPETEFVMSTPLGTVELDDGSSGGTLLVQPLAPELCSHVRLRAKGTQPGTQRTITADLSADLVLSGPPLHPRLEPHYLTYNHTDSASSTKTYAPHNGTTGSTTLTAVTQVLAPYRGWLEQVHIRCSFDPGSTTIGLHLNGNTTASFSRTETIAQWAVTRVRFGRYARFDQHDLLTLSVDPTNAPGHVHLTAAWRYERI